MPDVYACVQRLGVKVVVLEARDTAGGRVQSSSCAAFSCPVDLGASIITGTEVDTVKGLRPDPSAIVARCMRPRFGVVRLGGVGGGRGEQGKVCFIAMGAHAISFAA